jgi:23S rRNA (pseudouridine1915-N3)-methyltransferase
MRLMLVAIGRMKDGPERVLTARYIERANASGKSLGLSGPTIT